MQLTVQHPITPASSKAAPITVTAQAHGPLLARYVSPTAGDPQPHIVLHQPTGTFAGYFRYRDHAKGYAEALVAEFAADPWSLAFTETVSPTARAAIARIAAIKRVWEAKDAERAASRKHR